MHPVLLTLIVIFSTLLLLFLVYLFLIMTGSSKGVKRFSSVKFAHRGLHGGGIAENSMSAFRAAVEAGFGIELDIRLSRDGELVVFHDDDLKRVCGDERLVSDVDAIELSRLSLSGTSDGVPTFREVLSLVDGKVPLLVEIKELSGSAVSLAAAEMLRDYKGEFIVESFNPLSLRAFKKHLPAVPAGILSMHFPKDKTLGLRIRNFLLGSLLTNVICRPNFIAYKNEDARAFPVKLLGGVFSAVRFAWTVKSEEEELAAYARGFDSVIFEQYIPKDKI